MAMHQDGPGGRQGRGRGELVRAGVILEQKPALGWEGALGYLEKRKQVQKSRNGPLAGIRQSEHGGRQVREGLA